MKSNLKNVIINNRKKLLIAIFLTILMVVISNVLIQPLIFNMQLAENSKAHFLIECIFVLSMYVSFYYIIIFLEKLCNKDKKCKILLINFVIYFSIMTIFLLLMWPGHWVWDEFVALDSVLESKVDVWQSYITIIYMSLCLMIIPSPVGIVIIQIILISIIFSWINTKIYMRFNKKIVNIIFCIFMITPAIIINNLYPLRLTMYSYVMLLFFLILIFDKFEDKELTILRFVKLYNLAVLLMLWRSEGIIFVILTPMLMLLVYNKKGINILKTLALIILNIIIIISYDVLIDKLDKQAQSTMDTKSANDSYELTIYINPLSEMLQEELKGKKLEKNLQVIDKVLNIEILKKYPSYTGIPAYWIEKDLLQEDYQQHIPEFRKNYIELISNNLGSFLNARSKTFFATSSMVKGTSVNIEHRLFWYYIDPNYDNQFSERRFIKNFMDKYKFSNLINVELKIKVETALMGENNIVNYYNEPFRLIFWNFIPVIILIIICSIISWIKGRWIFLLIYISLIITILIIFLTAPANLFMYYLPIYMSGTIISLIYIFEEKNYKLIKNKI